MNSKEAKKLISWHTETLEKIDKASRLLIFYHGKIKDSIKNLSEKEAENILKEIPIDEINRGGASFRIKNLKTHGFHTVHDLYIASRQKIESVEGISQDSSYKIKSIVGEIVSKAKSYPFKIKLSTDNKTPEYSSLIENLYKYKLSLNIAKVSEELLKNHIKEIKQLILELSPAQNTINWLFTFGSKKNKVLGAYQNLVTLAQNEYGDEAVRIINVISELDLYTPEIYWSDFEKDTATYFKILEEISPGVLGNDDKFYGLSSNIADSLQEQIIDLEGLGCTLRRYQEWGVKYALSQGNVLLGDEMGLGKTIQAIATMVSLRNNGATHFLVICPASIISNWEREVGKMSNLITHKIHGADRQSNLEKWMISGGVAITTYETTSHIVGDVKIDMLVVDEAHYIKNPYAKRTQNVSRLIEKSAKTLFMTGTALENKVEEMIHLFSMLKPEVAGRLRGLESLSNAPIFREEAAPVYYRRKREDVLTELPELIESSEWLSMTAEEEKIYEQQILEGRFVQARRVSWSASAEHSSKAERLLELVEEATSEGRKIIVFSFFLDTIESIKNLLGDRCCQPINGSVHPTRRQEIVDEFDKSPAGTVLPAQIIAGGTGLNIQSASVVIICEPQFKPSTENQAISRAYRMGQTRNVLVYRLLCEKSVDEKITKILERKQKLFDNFADISEAAKESFELDEKMFGQLMREEEQRIKEKYGIPMISQNLGKVDAKIDAVPIDSLALTIDENI